MTEKTFLNGVSHSSNDVIEQLLSLLEQNTIDYCLIGGLAVNAYAEPVVSLDIDLVVASSQIPRIKKLIEGKFTFQEFPHSINLYAAGSDLRIQIQTDERYQDFFARAESKTVMGYSMRVASLPDVLSGKIWAYSDQARRKSKRQKDLADILRIIEKYPSFENALPETVKKAIAAL